MPIYHCTLFFCSPPFGWVEQFFRQDGNMNSAVIATASLAAARFTILGTGVNLYRLRVSQVGMPRNSVSVDGGGVVQPVQAMDARTGAEMSVAGAGTGLYRRTFLLRGLPKGSLAKQGNLWQFVGPYSAAINAWLGLLTSGQWQLQAWGRTGPAYAVTGMISSLPPPDEFQPLRDSSSFLVLINGNPTLPPVNPDTLEQPSVRIGRVKWSPRPRKGMASPNGEFTAAATTLGMIACYGAIPQEGAYLSGGYIQCRPRIYVPIGSWERLRLGSKACGKAPKDATPPILPWKAVPSGPPFGKGIQSALNVQVPAQLLGLNDLIGTPLPEQPQPPPVPPPPPPPKPIVLNSAKDILNLIYEYQGPPPFTPPYFAIGIAPILNRQGSYFVGINGFWPAGSDATGLLATISTGLGFETQYQRIVLGAVKQVAPSDSYLYLYGFSLGGMTQELLISEYKNAGYRTVILSTFGSPIMNPITGQAVYTVRYRTLLDMVPYTTVVSLLLSGLSGLFMYNNIPADPNNYAFPDNHMQFGQNQGLDNYDPMGKFYSPGPVPKPNDNTLELGPLQLFPLPPPT